jgi:hypothetical protein
MTHPATVLEPDKKFGFVNHNVYLIRVLPVKEIQLGLHRETDNELLNKSIGFYAVWGSNRTLL